MVKSKKVKKIPQAQKGVKETKAIEEIKVSEEEIDTTPESQKAKELEKEIDEKEIKLLDTPTEEAAELKAQKEPEKRILDFIPDEVEEGVSWFQKKISTATFITSHLLLLILGLIFAIGLYFLLYNSLPFAKLDQVAKYMPITTQPTSFNLEIKNPDHELWVFNSTILVSGKTSARANIVISSNDSDYGVVASNDGEFSKIINLDTGLNEITITGFDEEGNSKTENRTIFYSEEKPQ